MVFPREEHIYWLSNTKWSVLKKTHKIILYKQSKLYLQIYTYAHTHTHADVHTRTHSGL